MGHGGPCLRECILEGGLLLGCVCGACGAGASGQAGVGWTWLLA